MIKTRGNWSKLEPHAKSNFTNELTESERIGVIEITIIENGGPKLWRNYATYNVAYT